MFDKDYESIIGQIKKVKALAENGIGGEQNNAKNLLEKLLKKYKISLDELITEELQEYKFKYSTNYEKRILFQCLAKYANVNNYSNYYNSSRKLVRNVIGVNLTKMQFLDVKASTKFYVKLFAKDLELFFTAFISKHDIFREVTENDKTSESTLTPEEIEAIRNIMKGLSDTSYIPSKLQIEAKK